MRADASTGHTKAVDTIQTAECSTGSYICPTLADNRQL